MTDNSQAAHEAAIEAAFIAWLEIAGPLDSVERIETGCRAYLAYLAASGWQIVPVVATEGMCRAWEAATNGSMSFENTNDEEVNNIFARMDYAAMLAAAPAFPGREE